MMWVDRLVAAERTGEFTADDRYAIGLVEYCIVGEAFDLKKLSNGQALTIIEKHRLFNEFMFDCPDAVMKNNIAEARRLWEKVQKKAGLLQEVRA